jgi:hypothetical protein
MALRYAYKSVDLMRNRGVFGGFLGNKKILVRRTRGIVAMLYKYFFTAKKKIHTLAHNDEGTLLDFENKNNEDGLSELKILVSVVRFRPGPPRILNSPLVGLFSFGLADESFRLNEAQLSCPVPPHTFLG